MSVRSACPGFHARATAAPPFSGPRSRGNVVTCKPMPRQRGFALDASGTPRMGPAPGGTTAALLPLSVACYACACCHSSAGSPALVARSQADSGEWPQMAGAAASERQPSGSIKLDDRFPGTNSVDRLSRSDPKRIISRLKSGCTVRSWIASGYCAPYCPAARSVSVRPKIQASRCDKPGRAASAISKTSGATGVEKMPYWPASRAVRMPR